MYKSKAKKEKYPNSTITITFSECASSQGMKSIGNIGKYGFTSGDLFAAEQLLVADNHNATLYNLSELGNNDEKYTFPDAYLLVVRKFVPNPDNVFQELKNLPWDTQVRVNNKIVNKKARHVLCFDQHEQKPQYESEKCRVIAYDQVPLLQQIQQLLPKYLGPLTNNIRAEGNWYYDINSCGVGYHGDDGRKIVIGCRFGQSLPLHYQWYNNDQPIGNNISFTLDHGDMYVMCAKATGNDWKSGKPFTLRHAAGLNFYTDL